ncbi:MAG: hypothetical protein R2787_07615 [Saprospiraceae bacterium]
MKALALAILLGLCSISLAGQSCFPVDTYYEGTFFSYTVGEGTWHLTFGKDTLVNGLVCQQAAFFQQEDPPFTFFKKYRNYLYHTDGEMLYLVDTVSFLLDPLYPWQPSPGDTLAQPMEWSYFGQEFHRWVLDTFSLELGGNEWFAYRIVVDCEAELEFFHDTLTVVPRFGMFPFFGQDIPFLSIPTCSLFDGTFYTMHCAFLPALGVYGDSLDCAHILSTEHPEQETASIILSPNPTNGTIYLEGPGLDRLIGLNGQHTIRYQIMDAWGRSVCEAGFLPIDHRISVDGMPAGTYQLILRGELGNLLWTGSFVKVE